MAKHTIHKSSRKFNRKTGSSIRFGVLILLLFSSLMACSMMQSIADIFPSGESSDTNTQVEASVDGSGATDSEVNKSKDQFKSDSQIKNKDGTVHRAGGHLYQTVVNAAEGTKEVNITLNTGPTDVLDIIYYARYVAIILIAMFVCIYFFIRRKR